MSLTVTELAHALYVDPGDVRVLVDMIEPGHGEELPNIICGEIRGILDHNHERTMPQLWSQSDMDTWREETGLRTPPAELNHAPGQPLDQQTPPPA